MSDLISRQAALEAILNCSDIFVNNKPVMIDKVDAQEALLELPSAEPKKGKWIKNYNDLDLYTAWWYECSECECEPVNGMLTAFCPYCGADMRGGENEHT